MALDLQMKRAFLTFWKAIRVEYFCNALVNLRLNSYWIASGSNEMLLKVLRKFINEIPELDNCLIDSTIWK